MYGYIMSVNSHWFQKYEPSKLNNRKKVHLSKEIEDFFVFLTLTACILRTTLARKMYCSSFKSPDFQFFGPPRTEG